MKKRDEFADINRNKNHGGMIVFLVAVLAVCLSGVLCVMKMQQEQKYISLNKGDVQETSVNGEVFV